MSFRHMLSSSEGRLTTDLAKLYTRNLPRVIVYFSYSVVAVRNTVSTSVAMQYGAHVLVKAKFEF